MIVAATKAVAVCPEGNEFAVEPSGRISLAEYFMTFVNKAINP